MGSKPKRGLRLRRCKKCREFFWTVVITSRPICPNCYSKHKCIQGKANVLRKTIDRLKRKKNGKKI